MRTGFEPGWAEPWETPPSPGRWGFSGGETCTAWLGPCDKRGLLERGGCVFTRVCARTRVCMRAYACVLGSQGSRSLAEEPCQRPDLLLVRWRLWRQLLLLAPGLRCGRLNFLPLASGRARRLLEAGASVGALAAAPGAALEAGRGACGAAAAGLPPPPPFLPRLPWGRTELRGAGVLRGSELEGFTLEPGKLRRTFKAGQGSRFRLSAPP